MRSHHRTAILAIALSACGSQRRPYPSSSAKPAPDARPELELVVAAVDDSDDTPRTRVRFATTTPTGLVVTRTVSVPGVVALRP